MTEETERARTLLEGYAEDTGLVSDHPSRRYLWTDAFAVCGFLSLHRMEGDQEALDRARELVDRVHWTLGRHREDDPRDGWISGMDEEEGRRHPTAGGLRIGKPLPERPPDAPPDPAGEWDRDGQYFHYLTKWMEALHRVHVATGEARYLRWAVELARAAHAGFTVGRGSEHPRMHWKMSVDLRRPLVESMGQHDPLDGLLVFRTLDAAARALDAGGSADALADPLADALTDALTDPLADFRRLCRGRRWATDDPLGLGGLLTVLHRACLSAAPAPDDPETARVVSEVCETVREDVAQGLEAFAASGALDDPPGRRLPFRELGLSLGLHALVRLYEAERDERLKPLLRFHPLARRIELFWLARPNRQARTWRDHMDINRVGLAVSIAPEGYLEP